METNRLIEILELTKENLITKQSYREYGICGEFSELLKNKLITSDEKDDVIHFLYLNKPTYKNDYKEFRESEYWFGVLYWWKPIYKEPATRQIRIDYLTKLIANIK